VAQPTSGRAQLRVSTFFPSGRGFCRHRYSALAGRFASSFVSSLTWAAAIDGAFLIVLAAAIWREILAGKNTRNVPIALLVTIFALANLQFHLEGFWPELQGYGQRLALGVTMLLIALIGGRITPSFTLNWMARMGLEPRPEPFGWFDKLALAVLAVAAVCWIVRPTGLFTGLVLVVGSLQHLVRLLRWRGMRVTREPILIVLHIGYLWLVASLALLGLSALAPSHVAPSTALHALTAGAIGTMTLAVMTRASLGHTGREIKAGGATLAIYALVTIRGASPGWCSTTSGWLSQHAHTKRHCLERGFCPVCPLIRSDLAPARRRPHLSQLISIRWQT
jgi:uncharacterized protein involved in response to NO